MASIIKVDKIDPQSGTALEVGTSGDTVTVPSGVTLTTTNATLNLPTTITSTTEVKTNKVSPATGVAFSLGDSGDTFTVPSGATLANLGTATGFPETDLAPVNQDIITLALRQSVDNNSAKYNLPHAAVTQFESDADYDAAGSTDISRNAAEYISSVSVANSYTTTAGTPASNLTLGSGSWTGALTNDYTSGGGVGMYPDFLYDLAADWKIRVFNNDSSGDPRNTNGGYGMYCAVVTPDTSVAAGANPTVLRDQDASLGQSYGNWVPTLLRDQWLTDAYGGTIGTDAMSDNYASLSNNQSVDASSGATARGYNASTTNKNYGQQVTYDRGANTITIQPSNSADFSTMYGTSSCTFTSVPAAGRFMFYAGYANGSVDYVSTTRNSADNTIFGYFSTSSVSATGTALGTTNVPTAAVTSVSGVMLMKNAFGTNTLGTDVKVYFTADNSNWTEATSYTSAGTFSTGITQITLGQTTVTSGSDVRWKIVFANQSASSKEAYIYGMGTNY